MIMTTPVVTELPRRMEPIAHDPFLDGLVRIVNRPYPTHRRPVAIVAARSGVRQGSR